MKFHIMVLKQERESEAHNYITMNWLQLYLRGMFALPSYLNSNNCLVVNTHHTLIIVLEFPFKYGSKIHFLLACSRINSNQS